MVKRLLAINQEHSISLSEKGDTSDTRIVGLLFEGVNHRIWRILYRQLKGVDFSQEQVKVMTSLLINSLEMVQEDFRQDLPLNKNALTFYLQQKYLARLSDS